MSFEDFKMPTGAKAFLVSVVCENMPFHKSESQSQNSLDELEQLCTTLGLHVQGSAWQKRKALDASSVLGSGKLEEISQTAIEKNCELLVFDFELSAGQVRKIKQISNLEVLNRCNVILEIFAKHARTKEAKLQVEISRLEYLLPRLTSYWTHFGKQRGGIGLKGEGEQQLELDRRMVRSRISQFKKELKTVITSRREQGKRRKKNAITAALVGYTNAGKSSLMNRLCQVDVLEENKLFATLDSTFRMLNPDSKPPMVLIDTVGFLNNLPNTLIDGFKSTLESAMEADLLLIVCDLSHPHYELQLETTYKVLEELELHDKESCLIFNKRDLAKDPFEEKLAKRTHANSFVVSSFDPADMKALRKWIIDFFLDKQECYDLFVPYQHSKAHSSILGQSNLIKKEPHEKGMFYRIRTPKFLFQKLNLTRYLLSEES